MANPAFGQPKWASGSYRGPAFAQPAAPIFNNGTKTNGSEKPPAVAEVPHSLDTDSESTAAASADVPPPTASIASESATAPTTRSSVTSSKPSDSSTTSPALPAAGSPVSGEPTQTASIEAAVNSPSGTPRFGIQIGTAQTQRGLWPLWHNILTKHGALVAGLQARSMLAPDKRWQLIAGPFVSAAEATQACSLFNTENLKCTETAFAGDAL